MKQSIQGILWSSIFGVGILLIILLSSQKEPDFVIKYIEGHKYIITNQGGICHDEDCDNPDHYIEETSN